MRFHRYLDARSFARELEVLRAYRNEYVGDGLLESLEGARLLIPRVRVRFPDPVARRSWLDLHSEPERHLIYPIEPDGARWEAALALRQALFRWENHTVYGPVPHPLDDPDPPFAEFIQDVRAAGFVPWKEMRVDVSNDVESQLFDDSNVLTYYSSWQVPLAAELADAGVHFRINLADKDLSAAVCEALRHGTAPPDNPRVSLLPVHVARQFAENERALDAVVWYAEECQRALTYILKDQGGGRFRLSHGQNEQYKEACTQAAATSFEQHGVSTQDLITLCKFASERWSDWTSSGRPYVASAYKSLLTQTLRLTMSVGGLTFAEMRDCVGQVAGRFQPILDEIWPDWSTEEQRRVRRTLRHAIEDEDVEGLTEADVDAFVTFLGEDGLEAFFWRLSSFEHHALHGNEFAIQGMRSDLQGMAVSVEHVAAALGGTATQLYEKFKELWNDPDVLRLLKRDDVGRLARQGGLAQDWTSLKASIQALRAEKGGPIAADLVMAHRIRSGVHAILPEDDHFELEGLFVTLMRAAVLTFAHVRSSHSANHG
jgi:hypothetical protein